jgi:hypothetical protein
MNLLAKSVKIIGSGLFRGAMLRKSSMVLWFPLGFLGTLDAILRIYDSLWLVSVSFVFWPSFRVYRANLFRLPAIGVKSGRVTRCDIASRV